MMVSDDQGDGRTLEASPAAVHFEIDGQEGIGRAAPELASMSPAVSLDGLGVRELSGCLGPVAVDPKDSADRPGAPRTVMGSRQDRVWYVDEAMWDKIATCGIPGGPKASKEEAKTSFLTDLNRAYQSEILQSDSRHVRSVCGLPVLGPGSKFARIWAQFIMWWDLLYTAFFVPITVGFRMNGQAGEVDTSFGDWFVRYLDMLAGVIFILALVLGFHIGFIAYFHLRRAEVTNGKLVAKYYIHKGTFWIDLLSAVIYGVQFVLYISFSILGADAANSSFLQFLAFMQLFRMVRLIAVFKMVKRLLMGSPSESAPAWVPVHLVHGAIMLYMLYWIINASACLWFFVGSSYALGGHMNWLAVTVDVPDCYTIQMTWRIPVEPDPNCPDPPKFQFGKAYMLSSYWSVTTMTTVGYGDISPTNFGEMCAAMIVMLAGIMSFAVLIGSVQEVFTYASQEAMHASQLRGKLYDVDRWIHQHDLTPEIRKQVRRYFYECWIGAQQSYAADKVFSDLPEHLQSVVAQHLTDTFLSDMRIFKDIGADVRHLLASKLIPVSLSIGQDICDQGEVADRLWILEKGVMVAIYGGKAMECEEAPAIIGETTVLQDLDPQFQLRPCGYRATTTCTLWELDLRDLYVVLRVYPEASDPIHRGVAAHVLQRAGLLNSVGGEISKTALHELVSEMRVIKSRHSSPRKRDASVSPFSAGVGGPSGQADVTDHDLGNMGSVTAPGLVKLLSTIKSDHQGECSSDRILHMMDLKDTSSEASSTLEQDTQDVESNSSAPELHDPEDDNAKGRQDAAPDSVPLPANSTAEIMGVLDKILVKVNHLEKRLASVSKPADGGYQDHSPAWGSKALLKGVGGSPHDVSPRRRFSSAAGMVMSSGRAARGFAPRGLGDWMGHKRSIS